VPRMELALTMPPNVNMQTILLQMVCSLTLDGFSTRMKARERKGEKLCRAIRARIIPNDTSYINRKLAFLPAIQKINQTMILQIQFTCLNALDQNTTVAFIHAKGSSVFTCFCSLLLTCQDASTAIFKSGSLLGICTIDLSALNNLES
jgi:hypothetical protein